MKIIWQILGTTVPLGRIAGIPIKLHWSCFILVFLFIRAADIAYSHWTWGLADVGGLFLLLLLHELGHACTGRLIRVRTSRIILWMLGGFAMLEPQERWWRKLVVSLGGPLANLALVPALYALSYRLVLNQSDDVRLLCWHMYLGNSALLIFNLLPVWPLDGGRMVEAVLQAIFGYQRGGMVTYSFSFLALMVGIPLALYWRDALTAPVLMSMLAINTVMIIRGIGAILDGKRYGFHPSARCPTCFSPALSRPNSSCTSCGKGLNALLDDKCWNCGTPTALVGCFFCRSYAEAASWFPEAGKKGPPKAGSA